jgi:hypothetical protein
VYQIASMYCSGAWNKPDRTNAKGPRGNIQNRVYLILKAHPQGITVKSIAEMLRITPNAVGCAFNRLKSSTRIVSERQLGSKELKFMLEKSHDGGRANRGASKAE